MKYRKPERLQPGDTVAIVSPSWGGPNEYPHVYYNGLKTLRDFGLSVKEYPTARMKNELLWKKPWLRAKDINDAFADHEIKAVFAAIGGDDSVRILPYLDKKTIANNPKVFMGYSDTSTLHVFMNLLGNVTFYGPSVMAGFSQMKNLPADYEKHIRKILFSPTEHYEYSAYGKYCDKYLNWSDEKNVGKTIPLKKDAGWRWLQGKAKIQGELFGGCIEVLEMMKATDYWPARNFWKGKVFFLETSEDKPTVDYVGYVLRNYGMQGVFDKISGFIFSRARDYSAKEKKKLEVKIVEVIAGEFGRTDLPIVANFDVGHTDPQLILPLGVKVEIDCLEKRIALVEAWMK